MNEDGAMPRNHHPGTGNSGDPPTNDLVFPTIDEIAAQNGAFRLLDEEWRHPETRPADPSLPPVGGDPDLDWTALRQVNDAWAMMAIRKHGRVGRDPERIELFLRFFEVVWERHSHLRFGKLVSDVLSVPDPRMPLHAPEETTFVQLVGEWDDSMGDRQEAADPSTDEGRSVRRPSRIRPFLDCFQEAWKRDPDQRFGQLIANILRFRQPLESIESISDEDYIALINEWITG